MSDVGGQSSVDVVSPDEGPGARRSSETASRSPAPTEEPAATSPGLRGRNWWLATILVFSAALAALVPTAGDIGLTWDEPAYRYSQELSVQWWEQLGKARSLSDIAPLLDPTALLYYWPYARFGINFHPPLAGQLNLAAHAAFGGWMKDIPARRMASVIEFALTIALGFGFLARRYGPSVGLVAAGSVLCMPRLYGQAHLIDTDIPGLFLWVATALAFWKGLHEEHARRWRVAVGILLGLCFVEKMAAVTVILPIMLWLCLARLPGALLRPGGRWTLIDGAVTIGLMALPLLLAFLEIQALQRVFPPPKLANLFVHRPKSILPGAILVMPLMIWLARRGLGRRDRRHRIWGVERPGLETFTAILAFAPVVGWLGNPAWWRETIPRLAHYYTLSNDRRGALPDIQIIYFGQIYEYSLPWHNAWVLMAITVPVGILLAALVGLAWALPRLRSDHLPAYFLVHLLCLPVLRMLPTPAHDGVRLFLPSFFFLAAFAGWGAVALADRISRAFRIRSLPCRTVVGALVVVPAAVALVGIHPYELSYYNALIGGPRGAWDRGFEMTYWYDAVNGPVLDEINRRLPKGANVDFFNKKTEPMTFQELQTLGALRSDIQLVWRNPEQCPYVWLLSQDSKASAFTRLLYAMTPWYASEPSQLDGMRVFTLADPVAVSRAWALQILLDASDTSPPDPPAAPEWVREHAPLLARFWGDGLVKISKLALNHRLLDWAKSDPRGLLAAVRMLAGDRKSRATDPGVVRLADILIADPNPEVVRFRESVLAQLLDTRPESLAEAAQILVDHPDAVTRVMTRYGYTDPGSIGGYLDRGLKTTPSASREPSRGPRGDVALRQKR